MPLVIVAIGILALLLLIMGVNYSHHLPPLQVA
ncbi:hypothetical protein J2S25_002536 [Mesobacillus stamsii]|uniref:Uncharacterized protein n=1 Tax=Mesobacillus stamsii TaxID=225347 RepID=A0ABU0FYD3_9BACI|nr:hypothetical protein [Mesobacillus stamsii]